MQLNRTNERRGVILMVVLSLLTLFAIVGISFVLYADAEAASARIAREGESQQRADIDPEECLAMFLGQLLYDVNDDMSGVGSGLRGQSLGRTMYGYNYAVVGIPGTNIVPYNGVGRVHTGTTWPFLNPYKADDYNLVNYTWFSGDGFLRDPERYGQRANPAAPQTSPYVGGNAPYTYPDLNSFFLAAVKADGTVLAPSFHRPWLFQVVGGKTYAFNDMSNPNWTSPAGKYLTLRPRPHEHPNFPAPDDATGDVKNLMWSKGGNDSIWIDIGAPVMTAPDGTKYKMLVAPLIMDLDNRIHVGAAGNIAGNGNASRSNQGWFPSEVNLSWLWSNSTNNKADWLKLFLGNGSYYGKYGPDKIPSGPLFPAGSAAHVYGQADLDGRQEWANGAPTGPIQLPGINVPINGAAPATSCFPYFPPGYGSGSVAERIAVNGNTITYRHPAAYAAYKSSLYTTTTINSVKPPKTIPNDDLVFRPSDMEPLLRPNSMGQTTVDTGSSALISYLLRLCPQTLELDGTAYLRRNWITTISSDLAKPSLSPWIFNPLAPSPYNLNAAAPSLPPTGGAVPFPPFTQRIAPGTAANPNPPLGSDFTANWRAVAAALGRIDLNRPLPPFPHVLTNSGMLPGAQVGPNVRFDAAGLASPTMKQFQLAMAARQQFANDIYRRLLVVTGATAPFTNPANPTTNPQDLVNLATRRWLAQLAVNIVDYIDADEISTPFNFYTVADAGGAANFNIYQLTPTPFPTTIPGFPAGNPDVPAYWVFGTELPRVVINEALGEYTLLTNNAAAPVPIAGNFTVKIWVELFNPMPTVPSVTQTAANNKSTLQPQDSLPVPLYMLGPGGGTTPATGAYNPYQLVLANNNIAVNSNGLWYNAANLNGNVLGTPQHLRSICNFTTGNGKVGTVAAPAALNYPLYPNANLPWGLSGGTPAPLPNQPSFMLVGPPGNDVHNDITVAAGVPPTTPFLQSPNMQYQVVFTPPNKWSILVPGNPAPVAIADNVNGVSVLLRRLANPHLPPNPFTAKGVLANPALPPNPYVTVDYVHGVPLNGFGLNAAKRPLPISKFPAPIPPNNSPVPPASFGKLEPYAANFTQYALQTTPRPPVLGKGIPQPRTRHTLGLPNVPLDNPFTWLVHLDRKLISPMELLHVSGFTPHLLTQRFILVPNASNPVIPQPYKYTPPGKLPAGSVYFQHYVPWFDQSRRLYRIFELLETHDGASGISPVNGRVPGKININTLYDLPSAFPQIYMALADPSPKPDNPNFNAGSVTAAFQKLIALRTPNLATTGLSPADRPFLGMAAGVTPTGDPQYPVAYGFPAGNGINHTLLTSGVPGTQPTTAGLQGQGPALQLPNITPTNPQTAHPYLQNELLTKIYSRLTTRSNVFAVFVTVGFFEVVGTVPGSPNIPQLGAEIGRSEGRQVRHRMFAIVDRTNLSVFTTASSTPVAAPTAGSTTTTATITVPATSGVNANTGAAWSIQAGTQLVIEPGTANEETVTVTAVTANSFTANFLLPHPNPTVTGNPSPTYAIIQRGNPGPWRRRYDPRQDPAVVLYYSIID